MAKAPARAATRSSSQFAVLPSGRTMLSASRMVPGGIRASKAPQ